MPKKRRHHDISSNVLVASLPVAASVTEDSIESCLAELAAATTNTESSSLPSTSQIASATTDALQEMKSELWDPSLAQPQLDMDRISNWNRAMNRWMKTNHYSPGLLPSLDVEITRHFKVQALSTYLLDACKTIKMPPFERWLIDSKLEERQRHYTSTDPILCAVDGSFSSSQRLIEEIRESGVARNDAKKIVRELCHKMDGARMEVQRLQHLHGGQSPLKKGDRVELEKSTNDSIHTLVFHRKRWKKPFCIKLNVSHYNKLKTMFEFVHNHQSEDALQFQSSGKNTKVTHAFHVLVMSMLLRYSSLSGGQLLLDLRGGGMQGAIHGHVFQVLFDTFGRDLLEGFGSPLNAYLPAFGSAFPDDLDWHFGSVGNFLERDTVVGCCEANPPFSPGMMTAMASKVFSNIELANQKGSAVTFVVVVPDAGDDHDSQRAAAKRFGGQSLKKIKESAFCTRHILLLAKDHGYIEGAQHMRPTRFKESLYDTSVVILQSGKARQDGTDLKELEQKLRVAFASRHREETERRKQRKESATSTDSDSVESGSCAINADGSSRSSDDSIDST